MTTGSLRVLVCSTSASSHVLAGLISSLPDVDVAIYTRSARKAHAWRGVMRHHRLTVIVEGGQPSYSTGGLLVTNDPEEGARGRDVVILSLPAFMHSSYLEALAPYLERGSVIVGLPGQCGFEFEISQIFGQRKTDFVVVNFDSLPWVCQVESFGRSVFVAGTKEVIVGAVQGSSVACRVQDPVLILQRLLGGPPRIRIAGNILGITLRSPNAPSHPTIMYGCWKDWDGTAVATVPLFYGSISERTADLLNRVSQEIVATAMRIVETHPSADLSSAVPMYEWDMECYGPWIRDKASLFTALRTNSIYDGILHPMVQIGPQRFVPNFGHRFLSEDVPFGLAVLRGICEVAGVPTPNIDKVLYWSQIQLGKTYLTSSGMMGRHVVETRCPQRYGVTSIDQLLMDL
jgi:hypothetical protein